MASRRRQKEPFERLVVHRRTNSQPSRRKTSCPVKSKSSSNGHRSHSRPPTDTSGKPKRNFLAENKHNTTARRDVFNDYKRRFEERKAIEAAKKEEEMKAEAAWLRGLRPDSAGKPAFCFDFEGEEETIKKTERLDWKEKRRLKEEALEKQKQLEEKWLEELRPGTKEEDGWDYSTELGCEDEDGEEKVKKKSHKRIRKKTN